MDCVQCTAYHVCCLYRGECEGQGYFGAVNLGNEVLVVQFATADGLLQADHEAHFAIGAGEEEELGQVLVHNLVRVRVACHAEEGGTQLHHVLATVVQVQVVVFVRVAPALLPGL